MLKPMKRKRADDGFLRDFPSIDESCFYPLPELITSAKPNTEIYYTFCRANGKTLMQYEYIKAMLEAGYEFIPVKTNGICTTFLVRPRNV